MDPVIAPKVTIGQNVTRLKTSQVERMQRPQTGYR